MPCPSFRETWLSAAEALLSALATEVIPDERIGVGGEGLLAVASAVAIGIGPRRVGPVDVDLIPIGRMIAIRVGIGGIEAEARLQLVRRVVRVLIGRAGNRCVGQCDG